MSRDVEVFTDAAALRRLVPGLPEEISDVRWLRVASGNPGSFLPGPTDIRLFALLRPTDDTQWRAWDQAAGSTEGVQTVELPRSVAEALLHQVERNDDPVMLSGPSIAPGPLGAGPGYRVDVLIHVAGGVLLAATTT